MLFFFEIGFRSNNCTSCDGNNYLCAEPGEHLCAVNDHYYNGKNRKTNYSTYDLAPETLKKLTLTKDSSEVDTIALNEQYNLVGPYKLKSNCTESSISKITLKYTENGVTKQTKNTNVLVNSKGNSIGLELTQNKDLTFYIKVGINVERIDNLEIEVTTKNASKITTVTSYKVIYTCTGVGSGDHHDGYGNDISTTAEATQDMITQKTFKDEKDTYYNTSDTVEFGRVEIKGRIKITKTEEDTDKPMEGIGFTLKMTSGRYEGQYVYPDSNKNAKYTTEETTIMTDNLGIIEINLLEKGTYELIETVNPYYGYEELPKVVNSDLTIKNGGRVSLNIKNQRKYVKLSGKIIRVCMGRYTLG